jgi:hypothetical protein
MSEGRPLRHDEIRAYLLEVAEEMPWIEDIAAQASATEL